MAEEDSLSVLRRLVEEDPDASDKDILEQFRDVLSDRDLSWSQGDMGEQILLEVIGMLKREARKPADLGIAEVL